MDKEDIIAEIGASEHLFNDKKYFENSKDTKRIIPELADGKNVSTNSQGIVRVSLYQKPGDDDGIAKILRLRKVYDMPNLDMNLMLGTRLEKILDVHKKEEET